MPPYLAIKMEAIKASFIGSSVISAGKVMVGKPRGRNFLFRARLLMFTWSSSAWRTALAPESITISLMPASVSLAVSWLSSSRPEAFTATGHEFALASSATASRLSLLAAYIRGLRSAQAFKPAAKTLGSLLIRIMPESLPPFTLPARAANLAASSESHLSAISSGRRVRPTLS